MECLLRKSMGCFGFSSNRQMLSIWKFIPGPSVQAPGNVPGSASHVFPFAGTIDQISASSGSITQASFSRNLPVIGSSAPGYSTSAYPSVIASRSSVGDRPPHYAECARDNARYTPDDKHSRGPPWGVLLPAGNPPAVRF